MLRWMSAAAPLKRLATREDLLAIPEEERFHEIIAGDLVRKAMPSARHGTAQLGVGGPIRATYGRRTGGGAPGGWWIVTEVEIELAVHDVYRPDLSGWRRERLPALPRETPVTVRPDWGCEVLSQSNTRNDRVKKMRVYHRSGVPHYWILDPEAGTLEVYRWTADGYLLAQTGERGDRLFAEPFAAVELDLAALFGEDEDEEAG
jgi:Uma2 family endonuclease